MKTIVDLTEELKKYTLEKDTAAKQAVEANIAPVEADASSASRAYVVGEQLFLNDVLYDVTSPISVGDAIVVNTNITAANKLSADIQSKIDDLYSKNQTLTSAFVNNVNQSGSKNFANYDKTVTRGTSGSIGDTLFTLDLEVGDKITFVCTQDNAMVSNTRNTLQVVNSANTSIKFLESNDANFHLASGLHILQFTVETAGKYNFSIWTHTLGTETTYSKFMVCDTDVYNVNPDYAPYSKTNKELTDEVSSLNSALTKYVNEYGSKNLCPYEDTLSVPTTNTAGQLLASVELKAGDKITFVCTQDNAMTSNTRNTLIIDNPSGVRSVQSVATNNHLSAGLHVMEYTVTESGVHKFGIWAGTISTATTYSKFMICHTDVYNLDPTYEPYAKTNKELTDESELITLPATKNDNIVGTFVIRARKQHNAVYVTGYLSIEVAANKNDLLFTISELNFFDANDKFYILMMSSDGDTVFAEVYSNGEVKVGKNTGMPTGYYMLDCVLLVK